MRFPAKILISCFALAAALPCIGAAKTIDLYCEIEGSSFFEELRKTHPAAGTLVYRIDASHRSVKNIAGIFATDPILKSEWTELQIVAHQSYPQLTDIPGLTGFRVIRIDRTTGRFNITHEARNSAGRALYQHEVDIEFEKTNLPRHPFFATHVGVSADGKCAPREKIF